MMNVHRLDGTVMGFANEAADSELDQILQRLEALEARVAQLEQAAVTSRRIAPASNAAAFGPGAVGATSARAGTGATHAPAAASSPNTPARQPRAADDAPTERLHRMPLARAHDSDAFPDLSQLDEKVEPRKGPAERVDVRAALEAYPRIVHRVQELWGTPECEAYINGLVIDTRGNRRGFPPAMMEELLYLGRLARALVILGVNGDLWERYDDVGDRR